MREYVTETVTPTPRQEKRQTDCRCDLCGKSAPGAQRGDTFDDPERYDDYIKVSVECETGNAYPEGGWCTTEFYDVCPDCWRDRIKTLFDNPPQTKRVDW